MKATVGKADLDRAHDRVVAAVALAYGPMDVSGEMLCWASRIRRAKDKAQEIVDSGKLSAEQVAAIIADFETTYAGAKRDAQTAYDDYTLLCHAAGLELATFYRPECPCTNCQGWLKFEAQKHAKRTFKAAVRDLYDTDANDETIQKLRDAIALCKQFDVSWEK